MAKSERPTLEEKALVASYCQGCAVGKVLFRDAFAAARKDPKLARFDDKTLRAGMHLSIDQTVASAFRERAT